MPEISYSEKFYIKLWNWNEVFYNNEYVTKTVSSVRLAWMHISAQHIAVPYAVLVGNTS
jgi:hypothetical protein